MPLFELDFRNILCPKFIEGNRLEPGTFLFRFSGSKCQAHPTAVVKNLVNSSTHVGSHSRVRESSSSRSGQYCAYFCHVMGFDNLTKFCPHSSPRQSSLYLHPHIHQPACRLAVCVCPVFAHPAHLAGNRTMMIGPRLRLVTGAGAFHPSPGKHRRAGWPPVSRPGRFGPGYRVTGHGPATG